VVHIAWQDYTDYDLADQKWDIFYKYKTSSGSWSSPELVSTESTEDSWRPSLIVDSEGMIHVAWMDNSNYQESGNDFDIFYKYKNDESWSITEVVSTESTEDSYRPSMTVDNNGMVHISWFDLTDYQESGSDPDIFYKYKNDESWSITEVVSTESTYDSGNPWLMVDNDSIVHITWQDHTEYGGAGHDWDIFYKQKTSGGSWITTEIVSMVSGYLSEYPSLMVDNYGVVHIAWKEKTDYGSCGSDSDIFYIFRTSSGSWSNTVVVSTESTEYSYYPSLYADNSGTIHVAWYDYSDYDGSGGDADIFYKYRIGVNQPPNDPEISGTNSGKPGTSYDYTFTSIDPDGDKVSYLIKWGDGSITDWTTFLASGSPGYIEAHSWEKEDTFTIEAKAMDICGAESGWTKLDVTMPRNKILQNQIFLRFLEQFAQVFPIIQHIFGL
jgi:hypothetical protein